MKIITVKHKGRKIISYDAKTRPTTGKVREAIFSILTSGRFINEDDTTILTDATVIDLFCGTGSLGLEALSRGAKHLVMVDNNSNHLKTAITNARNIGEYPNISPIATDATMLPKARVKCNVAFIDPPYNTNLVLPTIKSLINQNWLEENAILVIETDKKEKIDILQQINVIDERIYGKTKLVFLEYLS